MRYLALLAVMAFSALSTLSSTAVGAEPMCIIQEEEDGGVLYFDCVGKDFATALGKWQKLHPEKKILAMAGNGTGTYGYDKGYFVVTENREP